MFGTVVVENGLLKCEHPSTLNHVVACVSRDVLRPNGFDILVKIFS